MNLWALGFSEDMSDQTKINQAIKYIMNKAECTSRFESNLEKSHPNLIDLETSLRPWTLQYEFGNERITLDTK